MARNAAGVKVQLKKCQFLSFFTWFWLISFTLTLSSTGTFGQQQQKLRFPPENVVNRRLGELYDECFFYRKRAFAKYQSQSKMIKVMLL